MEIKDFKMKCETIQQRDEVIRILEENRIEKDLETYNGTLTILVDDSTMYCFFDMFDNLIVSELTYSEFMQLYAEPKQEFTVNTDSNGIVDLTIQCEPKQDELMELKEWINETFDMGMDGILEINGKINEIIERRSNGKTN